MLIFKETIENINRSSIMKSKGSILSIVLICFIYLYSSIFIYTDMLVMSNRIHDHINILFKQKNLEIILLHMYEDMFKNDGLLLSEEYEINDSYIKSDVEVLDDYYVIITNIECTNFTYSFKVKLKISDGDLYDLEYIEKNV